jgi:YbbR-like protein
MAKQVARKFKKKPKYFAFLGFLLVSFVIWLMITLSHNYISTIRLQMNYVNVPDDKLLLGDPDAFLDASVYASGYRLLNYKVFRKRLSLNVSSFMRGDRAYYLTRRELESQLKDQYEGLEVRRVYKDTLWLSLGVNISKKVRVVPDLSVNFREDHEFAEPLLITPDSLVIKGPEDVVSTIDSLMTEKVVLRGVKDDFEREVYVLLPDSVKKVQLPENAVKLTAKVARYSEKVLEVPLTVVNVPDDVAIKTFPSTIRVLCKANISDLKRLVPSGFRVVCDYEEITKEHAYLLPRVEEKPSFVKAVTLLDNKVEYLINRS